jgi:uncharacterized protein (TIGR02145 family)
MKINQIGLSRLAAEKIQQTEVLMKTRSFLLAAGISLALAFTFSCSMFDDCGCDDRTGGGSSSSGGGGGGGGNSFSYCLINGQCINGSFTSKMCGDLGGLPSNSCNGGGNPSSSSNGGDGGNPGGNVSSCPVSADSYNSVTCGGQTYKTVQIGNQKWFAENLNYDPGTGNSACYGNQVSNCATYGRLYDWSTAMGVCPNGWHLPSDGDWQTLVDFAGGNSVAGEELKAMSGWNDYYGESGNGTDEHGFSALPGGFGFSDGDFSNVRYTGIWWSATESGSHGDAYRRHMNNDNSSVDSDNSSGSNLFSVRCVQD